MEPGLRDDLATRADTAELKTAIESMVRRQTWRLAGLVVGASGLMFAIARIA